MSVREPSPSHRIRRSGRPPGSRSDATRSRILQAARAAFARTGYLGTTNKDIAELFMATVRDAQAEIAPRYRQVLAATTSAREAIRALFLASADLHASDPSLSAFLSTVPVEMSRHEEIASEMAKEPSEVVAIVAEVVERGVRAGEIASPKSDGVAAMLLACALGLSVYAASIDPGALPGAAEALVALIDGDLLPARPLRRKRG
jgi:AcrR family transcriptional regulator